jgi:Domain of unknown function (DUF4397)
MKLTKLTTRAIRMVAATALATMGLAVAQVAVAAPFASASSHVGYIRLAHLSPNTPAVDVYLYSFGNPKAQVVIPHVAYGTVSQFMPVAAGDYTVAMRGAGAPARSKPVLSTAVDVTAGHAYTVAGMGPASGLRLQVIPDRLTTPHGKALVRIIQASMQQNTVTVTAGSTKLASHLKFARVTSFVAVNAGTWSIRAAGNSESATASINLVAGSIHTIVVLDEGSKLGLDDLLDAQGSKVDPASAPQTGFGGTAARSGAAMLPWAAAGVTGLAIAVIGTVMLSRRRRPALHAR